MEDKIGKNNDEDKDKNNSLKYKGQYSSIDGSTLAQSRQNNEISINKLKNSSVEEEIKFEEEITKRIKVLQITNSLLQYRELREIALQEMNKKDCFNFQNNTIQLIDINKIRKAKKADLEKKISEIKDPKMSHDEKLLKILDDMNSSETIEYGENNIETNKGQESSNTENAFVQIQEKNEIIMSSKVKDKSLSIEDSTYDQTGKSTRAETGIEIKHDFWIKNEYYDLSEYSKDKKGIKIEKIKGKDNKENMAFIYQNDLNTYYFTISQKLFNFYELKTITPEKKDELDKETGLYFCGKKIEQFNKICKPNEMMCKDCMKKNKEIYHLDNHRSALININGRVCTNSFKDKQFRCYGKFIDDKVIKNCIVGEFICNACKELSKNEKYYYGEK